MKINLNHFLLIADAIQRARIESDKHHEIEEDNQAAQRALDVLVENLCVEFAKHNDGFDPARFRQSCALPVSTP